MTTLTVVEFESRMRRGMYWVKVNRSAMAEIAEDLRSAAAHMEQVGWVRFMDFLNPTDPQNSPCCAVGALRSLGHPEVSRVSNTAWAFKDLYGQDLTAFNDYAAETVNDVTVAMRQVAAWIDAYLAATGD